MIPKILKIKLFLTYGVGILARYKYETAVFSSHNIDILSNYVNNK
jgi:hypothetical protein